MKDSLVQVLMQVHDIAVTFWPIVMTFCDFVAGAGKFAPGTRGGAYRTTRGFARPQMPRFRLGSRDLRKQTGIPAPRRVYRVGHSAFADDPILVAVAGAGDCLGGEAIARTLVALLAWDAGLLRLIA